MWSVKNGRTQPNLSDNPISDIIVTRVRNGAGGPDKSPGIWGEREKKNIDLLSCNETMPVLENAGGEILDGQEHG